MATRFSILFVCASFALAAQALPLNTTDAQSCTELCNNCKGVATFDGERCECNIEGNAEEGAECMSRMKRKAEERGLNVVSCDVSIDKRSTRCTMALKQKLANKLGHKLGMNNIDQVAKYFMEDGPITGKIFNTHTVGKSSDCVGSSNVITQPAETFELKPVEQQQQHFFTFPNDFMDTQPIVSSPSSHHFISSLQNIAAPHFQHIFSSPSHMHLLSNSAPMRLVSSPSTMQLISSPAPKQLFGSHPTLPLLNYPPSLPLPPSPPSLPLPPSTPSLPSPPSTPSLPLSPSTPSLPLPPSPPSLPIPSSPPSLSLFSSLPKIPLHKPFGFGLPKLCGCQNPEGLSSHTIITPPKETLPEPNGDFSIKISNLQAPGSDCGLLTGLPKVGANSPLHVLGQAIGPSLLQILGQQLSYPMLGIPQVLQSISKSPGISNLVSAPGTLLTGLAQKLGAPPLPPAKSTSCETEVNDIVDNVITPTAKVEVPKPAENCEQSLGLETSESNVPSNSNTLNPGFDSQLTNLLNPAVGSSGATHISYIHQLPAYTSIPLVSSSMINLPHLPTSYIVGSPFSLPWFKSGPCPLAAKQPDTTVEESLKLIPEHVAKLKMNLAAKTQKKICKKSNNEEFAPKVIRDVNGESESITDEELEKQSKIIEAANQQTEQNTTELPKIDKTTTQKPAIEQLSEQTPKVIRSIPKVDKPKSDVIGKVKPAKEIIKKVKVDKKSIEKRSIISF